MAMVERAASIRRKPHSYVEHFMTFLTAFGVRLMESKPRQVLLPLFEQKPPLGLAAHP